MSDRQYGSLIQLVQDGLIGPCGRFYRVLKPFKMREVFAEFRSTESFKNSSLPDESRWYDFQDWMLQQGYIAPLAAPTVNLNCAMQMPDHPNDIRDFQFSPEQLP